MKESLSLKITQAQQIQNIKFHKNNAQYDESNEHLQP